MALLEIGEHEVDAQLHAGGLAAIERGRHALEEALDRRVLQHVAERAQGDALVRRALAQLDEMGVMVGGLVVNRVLPGESGDTFLRARRAQERVYLDEIEQRFADRARLALPQYPRDVYGLARLGPSAHALSAAVQPVG